MLLSFDESHEFWSWLLIWENSLLPYKDELNKKEKSEKSHRLQYLLQSRKKSVIVKNMFNSLIGNYHVFLFCFPKVTSAWSESVGIYIYHLEKVSRPYQEREKIILLHFGQPQMLF